MQNATTTVQERPPGAKMTIRVYTVSPAGTVTPPRATVTVPYGRKLAPVPASDAFPPCRCPFHRAGGAR